MKKFHGIENIFTASIYNSKLQVKVAVKVNGLPP